MIASIADTHTALWYLFNDARLSAAAGDFIDDPDHLFKEAFFTGEIVDAMRRVPRTEVPDMPDRIVAATGVYFGVPVISRDGRIRASKVQTIW
jgi:PIN domain nuclease of toxin-antitoxin system